MLLLKSSTKGVERFSHSIPPSVLTTTAAIAAEDKTIASEFTHKSNIRRQMPAYGNSVLCESLEKSSSDSMGSSFGSMLESSEYSRLVQSFHSSFSSPKNTANEVVVLGAASQLNIDALVKLAKDPAGVGNRELQQRMDQDERFRQNVLRTIVNGGKENFLQLCIDCNACFVIQKLVENGGEDMQRELFSLVRPLAFKMVLNRFACRIVQKVVINLTDSHVHQLLCQQFKGHENTLVTDQNGNHFVQCVVEHFAPDVYGKFVLALATFPAGLNAVFENKYGCRVIQLVLERIVQLVNDRNTGNNEKDMAFSILHELMEPILKNAKSLAQNEYANYLVQFVLKSPHLRRQRCYIIKNHIIGNVYHLSLLKYSSHVVEQAFRNADSRCFCLTMLFKEVLEGVEGKYRTALCEMLFNQVSRLLF
uniref:PUM-HD domain-containing protein n=1 Tax=Globodera pallida TaxID=36090 RepID=A0A183C5Q5_GLOPA